MIRVLLVAGRDARFEEDRVVHGAVGVSVFLDPGRHAVRTGEAPRVADAVARGVALHLDGLSGLGVEDQPAIRHTVSAGVLFAASQAAVGVVLAPHLGPAVLIGVELDAHQHARLEVLGAIRPSGASAVDAPFDDLALAVVGLGLEPPVEVGVEGLVQDPFALVEAVPGVGPAVRVAILGLADPLVRFEERLRCRRARRRWCRRAASCERPPRSRSPPRVDRLRRRRAPPELARPARRPEPARGAGRHRRPAPRDRGRRWPVRSR